MGIDEVFFEDDEEWEVLLNFYNEKLNIFDEDDDEGEVDLMLEVL